MKEIHLITTSGCEGCRIMRNILLEARGDADIPISEYSTSAIPDKIRDKVTLTDFPTTLFILENNVARTVVGTESVTKIKSILKELDFV